MNRFIALIYGALSYLVFLAVFLLAIWFVWSMDAAQPASSVGLALLADAALLSLFALQHSGMARQSFKRAWTRFIPAPVERSTYVLASSVALLILVLNWQPLPGLIWQVQAEWAVTLLSVLFWFGWLMILVCTFLIDHGDLFGLKQVWRFWRGQPYEPPAFVTPGPYRFVRHPLYLGFLIAFWSAPRMTTGHLFFAVMCTAYILVAIRLEERDLITYHGEDYKIYRSGVSMLVPMPGRKKAGSGQ